MYKKSYINLLKKITISTCKSMLRRIKSFSFLPKEQPLPTVVRLEASTFCQLDCVQCYMRLCNYVAHGAGYLKYVDFVKFLDKNPYIRKIELSNSGEIFLNPDLFKIIQHAYSKGVKLQARNGVNFNNVSDEMLEALVKYEFQRMNISLDGASQEIYSQYRRKGNFDTVINNIKKLNEYKKKYNSKVPIIYWQYIIFEWNDLESEIRKAQEMAASLDATVVFGKAWDGYITKNAEIINQKYVFMPCPGLWNAPQINWDGRFFGCCVNSWQDFGINVFEIGLEEALNSKIVKKTKKMLMGQGKCENSPCCQCHHYKEMAKNDSYLTNSTINNWIEEIRYDTKISS